MSKESKSEQPRDSWARGSAYEPFVGRWSRLVAHEFLNWMDIAPGSHWLDVGCGTGALSQAILDLAAPGQVRGIDPSEGFITFVRKQIHDPRASFEVGDARALTAKTQSYDAAVSGLALNFIPQPEQAVSEMQRVVKPGGIVAAYLWDYSDKMQMLRFFWDAAIALNPNAIELDEGRRFPLCQPKPLADLFQGVGLKDVEVLAIDIHTDFRDFEDYWSPFLGGQGPAPAYVMSLSAAKRKALGERIRTSLPHAKDGTIRLLARAWALRSKRPQMPFDKGDHARTP